MTIEIHSTQHRLCLTIALCATPNCVSVGVRYKTYNRVQLLLLFQYNKCMLFVLWFKWTRMNIFCHIAVFYNVYLERQIHLHCEILVFMPYKHTRYICKVKTIINTPQPPLSFGMGFDTTKEERRDNTIPFSFLISYANAFRNELLDWNLKEKKE